MEEERKAKNCELDIEEVNVYTDDCGVIKYGDCEKKSVNKILL